MEQISPEQLSLAEWRQKVTRKKLVDGQCYLVEWQQLQPWAVEASTQLSSLLYCDMANSQVWALILEGCDHDTTTIARQLTTAVLTCPVAKSLSKRKAISAMLGRDVWDLIAPIQLEPVNIAKPWGREVWFSGAERRGVSIGNGLPLPWWLPLLAEDAAGQPPVLMKRLEPNSDPLLGNLYFEAHHNKSETYIVRSIDPACWRQSTGQLKYGFSREKLADYNDENAFRSGWLESVQAYELIRRQIDAKLDRMRIKANIPLDEPLRPEQMNTWLDTLDPSLIDEEARRRLLLEEFIGTSNVQVGDSIHIEPRVPHALQFGISVFEFQTPYYERQLLFFGQKALTQDHWDNKNAIDWLELTTPASIVGRQPTAYQLLVSGPPYTLVRVNLAAGKRCSLRVEPVFVTGCLYIMVEQGSIEYDHHIHGTGDGFILGDLGENTILTAGMEATSLLVAINTTPEFAGKYPV